ncbi:hypothetical protein MAR_035702, partial [Mya arenaria]
MASIHDTKIQCEMCCNEVAVGYCKTCGNVGKTCIDVHKTVKVFLTHNVSLNEKNNGNPTVTKRDIAEDRCMQHPTERTRYLCEIHDSLICDRCFHSEHASCVEQVVDLLHEDRSIDCNKIYSMKSLFTEFKAEIMFLKDEAKQSKENCKTNADKCLHECMELGNKIKHRVDVLTSSIIDGIRKKYDENLNIYSHISKTCDEKARRCDNEEKDKVILKCLFDDLEDLCELQEEVTGSDDGNTNDVVACTTKINKTRRELTAMLNQIKQDSEKGGAEFKDNINWTQPTRTVNVTVNLSIIELAFTFPDGLQT